MSTGSKLATRPSDVMRAYTSQVRDHASAFQRLQDQYFAALKRAENQYFEGVRKITETIAQATAPEPPASGNGDIKQSESALTDGTA